MSISRPILHWDLAKSAEYPGPPGSPNSVVAFDGTSVWTTGSIYASKFNRSTGARVDYSIGAGSYHMAFDGTNMWVTSFSELYVSRINATTGVITQFPARQGMGLVVFDGTYIWAFPAATTYVPGCFSCIQPDYAYRYDIVTGTRTDVQVGHSAGANNFVDAVFDGSNIWTVAQAGGAFFGTQPSISRTNPTTGAHVEYPFSNFGTPRAMAFDGTYLWITTTAGGVKKVDPASGAVVASFTTADSEPDGISYDGANIWITNYLSNTVSKMNPADGSRVELPVGSRPGGVAFDGSVIWAANSISNTLSTVAF